MLRVKVANLESVKTFLSAKSRTSKNTSKAYLTALRRFNESLNPDTVETILHRIIKEEKDVYNVLDSFVGYLKQRGDPATSIIFYMAGVKSYLAYHGIDIVPRIFKNKVFMPKVLTEEEQAIDASIIRKILLKCNKKLKVYVLILASGGMREVEALAIRIKDIYFDTIPTTIHIRKEYAKTHVGRDRYISDEAAKELKDWIYWKYRPETGKMKKPDDLVFAVSPRKKEDYDPNLMYANITKEFIKTLELAGLSERKEKSKVHTITLKSFRSFVKSTISDITGRDYSEWFIGHKDPYYKKNKQELRDIYKSKCMKYLTFLDYPLLEATGKSIDAELQVKDKQIQSLASRVESKDKEMQELRDKMAKMEESQTEDYRALRGDENSKIQRWQSWQR